MLFAERGSTDLDSLAFSADNSRLGVLVRERGFWDRALVRFDKCILKTFDLGDGTSQGREYSEATAGYQLVHVPYAKAHPLLGAGELLLVGGVPGTPPQYPLEGDDVAITLREAISGREIGVVTRPRRDMPTGSVALSPTKPVLALALSRPTGQGQNAVDEASIVELVTVPQGRSILRFAPQEYYLNRLAFSPDGRRFAAAGGPPWGTGDDHSSRVFVWDADTGELLHERDVRFRASSMAFSPDGETLVVGGLDGVYDGGANLARWKAVTEETGGEIDLARPARAWREKLGETRVRSLAFSPDGRFLAAGVGAPERGGKWGEVRLLDAESLKLVATLLAKHDFEVVSVLFSPDGRWLVAMTRDDRLLAWDMTKLEVQ